MGLPRMTVFRFAATVVLVGFVTAACGRPPPPPLRATTFAPAPILALEADYVTPRLIGLDGNDRRRVAEAMYTSLENGRPGQPNPWRNVDSGRSGEVVPGPATVGTPRCRPFVVRVDGAGARSLSGTACREPDGMWRVTG
jgi:surface antigen